MATDTVLVGFPDIAALAQVSTQAVSNWRKRYDDFPEPRVQSDSGVLFDLRSIEEWLLANGRIDQPIRPGSLVWRVADALRGSLRDTLFDSTSSMLFDFTSSWLCYLEACARADRQDTLFADELRGDAVDVSQEHRWSEVRQSADTVLPRRLRAAARAIETANPPLEGLLSALAPEPFPTVDLVRWFVDELEAAAAEPTMQRFELFEDAQQNTVEVARTSGESTTPDNISHLITELIDEFGSTTVDPACGTGGLLLMAAVKHPGTRGDTRFVGVDINATAARHTRARFFLYGIDAEILSLDSLRRDPSDWPSADIVLCDPPYSAHWGDADLYRSPRWRYGTPPPAHADMAWVQLALSMLKPTGSAAVVLPPGSCFRGGVESEIRGRLVRAGLIEALILLPARLRRDTSIPLTIWLLREQLAPADDRRLLLVDASAVGTPGRSIHDLSESDIDEIVQLVRQWRSDRLVVPTGALTAVAVDVEELADAAFDLTPRRHQAATTSSDLDQLRVKVQDAYTSTRDALTLARQAVDLLDDQRGALTAGGPSDRVKLGTIAEIIRPRAAKPDGDMVARDGDLLLTTTPNGYAARLLAEDETITGLHAIIMRVRPGVDVSPAWLLAWTSTEDFTNFVYQYAKGTTSRTLSVKDLAEAEIQVAPAAAQDTCRDLLASLDQLDLASQQLTESAAKLRSAALSLHYAEATR